MKYLCRNNDNSLTIFDEVTSYAPEYNTETGIFTNTLNELRCRYGYLTFDPEHLYDSLKPGEYIKGEHIKHVCDFCYKISSDVEYTESPYNLEIHDKKIMNNYCKECEHDEYMEI